MDKRTVEASSKLAQNNAAAVRALAAQARDSVADGIMYIAPRARDTVLCGVSYVGSFFATLVKSDKPSAEDVKVAKAAKRRAR